MICIYLIFNMLIEGSESWYPDFKASILEAFFMGLRRWLTKKATSGGFQIRSDKNQYVEGSWIIFNSINFDSS